MELSVTSLEDRVSLLQKRPGSLSFAVVAEELRQAGRHQEALRILEEGLRFHSSHVSARVVAAQCKAELRRFADALSDLDLVLEESPENLKARKLRAEVYLLLHQHKSAMKELTDIVSRYPQDTDSVLALEKLEDFLFGPLADTRFAFRASSDASSDLRASPPAPVWDASAFRVASVDEAVNTAARSGEPAEDLCASGQPIREDDAPPGPQAHAFRREPVQEESMQEEPAFATRTIAELYMRQGLEAKARKVLETLLHQNPLDQWARGALRKLNEQSGLSNPALSAKTAGSSNREKVRRLERFLTAVRSSS